MISILPIETIEDAQGAIDLSRSATVVIYKHSPICSISETALEEFETFASGDVHDAKLFSVDVLAARPASQKIEEITGVRHESPQVLVLADGKVVWHASHRRIRTSELSAQAAALA